MRHAFVLLGLKNPPSGRQASRISICPDSYRDSTECDIQKDLLCYSCIFTLSPQSEIRISFVSASSIQEQVMDVSYTSNNETTCINMHD